MLAQRLAPPVLRGLFLDFSSPPLLTDEEFLSIIIVMQEEIIKLIRKYRSNLAPMSVLDLGCGRGGNTIALAKEGAKVLAVDRNPEMLKHTVSLAHKESVFILFQEGSAVDFSSPHHYDVVLFTNVLHFIPEKNQKKALENILDNLVSPGTVFVFSDLIDDGEVPEGFKEMIRKRLANVVEVYKTLDDSPHKGVPYPHTHLIYFIAGIGQ